MFRISGTRAEPFLGALNLRDCSNIGARSTSMIHYSDASGAPEIAADESSGVPRFVALGFPATVVAHFCSKELGMYRLASLALLLLSASTQAADYPPVECAERAAYGGRPLHAAVLLPSLDPISEHAMDPGTIARLEKMLVTIRAKTDAPAITAAIGTTGGGVWTGGDTVPLFWASAGKTFTAVVILQLADEGKLSLEDPVSRWIKRVPNGDVATVRDLLSHTAGLFSANEDIQARAQPRYRAPAETLAIARRHGAMFCPGANWRYSNTGYDLLGEIVRLVDGRPIDQAITARIIQPLGLTTLRALPPGEPAKGVAPLVSTKEKPIDPSWAGAAGPIVGSAGDMVRFWTALLGGKLVAKPLVDEMTATLYPMFDQGTFYGLGAMLFDVPDGDERLLWIGHAGGTPGGSAWSPILPPSGFSSLSR